MDNSIKLKNFHDSPIYWQKFISSIMKEYNNWHIRSDAAEIVSDRLKEYQATYQPGIVTFKNPEHKTWFILKWS